MTFGSRDAVGRGLVIVGRQRLRAAFSRRTAPSSGPWDTFEVFVPSIVASLRADPRRAFVIDGAGALVSAIALGLVLPSFAGQLGTTRPALSVLAVLPVVFALYDVACVLLRPSRWQVALRVIAVANASYPPISIAVLLWDGVALTALGEAYFAIEIAIVWTLALLQLRTAAAGTRAA